MKQRVSVSLVEQHCMLYFNCSYLVADWLTSSCAKMTIGSCSGGTGARDPACVGGRWAILYSIILDATYPPNFFWVLSE